MVEIDKHVDSLYYFATNKGYGTLAHRNALQDLGATPYHRNTFYHEYFNICDISLKIY